MSELTTKEAAENAIVASFDALLPYAIEDEDSLLRWQESARLAANKNQPSTLFLYGEMGDIAIRLGMDVLPPRHGASTSKSLHITDKTKNPDETGAGYTTTLVQVSSKYGVIVNQGYFSVDSNTNPRGRCVRELSNSSLNGDRREEVLNYAGDVLDDMTMMFPRIQMMDLKRKNATDKLTTELAEIRASDATKTKLAELGLIEAALFKHPFIFREKSQYPPQVHSAD